MIKFLVKRRQQISLYFFITLLAILPTLTSKVNSNLLNNIFSSNTEYYRVNENTKVDYSNFFKEQEIDVDLNFSTIVKYTEYDYEKENIIFEQLNDFMTISLKI